MRRNYAEQIVQAPDLAREIGLRQNPPAAQPAQSVNLRQTAGGNELAAQVKSRARREREYGVKIDFIDQDLDAGLPREGAEFAKRVFVRARARPIVQIGDDYRA